MHRSTNVYYFNLNIMQIKLLKYVHHTERVIALCHLTWTNKLCQVYDAFVPEKLWLLSCCTQSSWKFDLMGFTESNIFTSTYGNKKQINNEVWTPFEDHFGIWFLLLLSLKANTQFFISLHYYRWTKVLLTSLNIPKHLQKSKMPMMPRRKDATNE